METMKNNYTIYKPRILIRDVYDNASYYRSTDVEATPFTKVGALNVDPEPHARLGTKSRSSTKSEYAPVFRRDYAFEGIRGTDMPVAESTASIESSKNFIAKNAQKPKNILKAGWVGLLALGAGAVIVVQQAASILARPFQGRSHGLSDKYNIAAYQPRTAQKYVLHRGRLKDSIKNMSLTARVVIPGVAALVALLVFGYSALVGSPGRHTQTQSGNHSIVSSPTSAKGSVGNPTTSTNKSNSSQQTAQSGITSTSKGSGGTSPSSTAGSATPTAQTPTIGGMGAGPSPGSATTTPDIPGVTSPYPITVPGQTVPLDGKQVVGTSPATVTLN
jgi:hypothetical protein